MANRYKRNSSSRSRKSRNSGSLSGVYMLVGMVIGILVATAGYMFFTKQSSATKPNPTPIVAKASHKSANKEKEAAQRFEFYTLLPGMEVQLPDAPANSKNRANKNHEPVNVIVQQQSSPTQAEANTSTQRQTHLQPKTTAVAKSTDQNLIAEGNNSKGKNNLRENNAKNSTDSSNATNIKNSKIANSNSPNANTANLNAANSNANVSAARYIVQAGIFQELNLADTLKAKLTLQGFSTRIQKVQTQEGHTWFRVTLGPFASESSAQQQKKRLEDQQIQGILILQRANS
jgi:cell division protein FtsN